jgi:hypothetical protein
MLGNLHEQAQACEARWSPHCTLSPLKHFDFCYGIKASIYSANRLGRKARRIVPAL